MNYQILRFFLLHTLLLGLGINTYAQDNASGFVLKRGTIVIRKKSSSENIKVFNQPTGLVNLSGGNIQGTNSGGAIVSPSRNEMQLGGDWRLTEDQINEEDNIPFARIMITDSKVYLYDRNDEIIDSARYRSFLGKREDQLSYLIEKDGYSGNLRVGELDVLLQDRPWKEIKVESQEKSILGERPEYSLSLIFPSSPKTKLIFYPYGKELLFGKWKAKPNVNLPDSLFSFLQLEMKEYQIKTYGSNKDQADSGLYIAIERNYEQYILGKENYGGYKKTGTINFNLEKRSWNNITYEFEEKKVLGEVRVYTLWLYFPNIEAPIVYELQ